MGLDLMLRNMQDQNLRLDVLRTLHLLMTHDPLVGVKVLKMKIVSNVVRHFVLDSDPEESLTKESS